MKVNSDSLKEDVLRMLRAKVSFSEKIPPKGIETYEAFVVAAVELSVIIIDHDKIETPENLVECEEEMVERILLAAHALLGRVRMAVLKH